MVRPSVFLCRGSSCRHHAAHAELRERLDEVVDVLEVRCQRICSGPFVGAAVNGSLEWFERVRAKKVQRRLVDLVAGRGRLRRSLEKRRVPERAGKMR